MKRSCDISVTELYGLSLLLHYLFCILSFLHLKAQVASYIQQHAILNFYLCSHCSFERSLCSCARRYGRAQMYVVVKNSNAFLDSGVARTPGPEYEKACGGTAYNTEVNSTSCNHIAC